MQRWRSLGSAAQDGTQGSVFYTNFSGENMTPGKLRENNKKDGKKKEHQLIPATRGRKTGGASQQEGKKSN